MKRLLLIFILTVSFQSWAMSEVDIGNLFGVKILDDVKLYANENDGVEHDVRPDIFYFSDEVIDIQRNEDFDRFYLRTDNKFKIINITGKRFLPEKNKTFVNNCLTEKNKLVKDLSIFYDIFDLICGISALEEDGSELETRYNDTITALGLISKYDNPTSLESSIYIPMPFFLPWR